MIHAVGPDWHDGRQGESAILASCYRNSLDLGREAGVTSIAFPAISTGIFGYPPADAARVAVEAVRAWLADDDTMDRVVFCVFGDEAERTYRAALEG